MRVVSPTERRSTVEQTIRGIRLYIPAPRNIFVMLFLGFWLCGWAVGEFMAAKTLLGQDGPAGGKFFLVAWLGGWTVGGVAIITMWFWMALGRTVLEVADNFLTVRREILGIGFTRAYDIAHISNLRVRVLEVVRSSRSGAVGTMRGGPIQFDYGAKTVMFGIGLAEAEARMVLADLAAALPETALAPEGIQQT